MEITLQAEEGLNPAMSSRELRQWGSISGNWKKIFFLSFFIINFQGPEHRYIIFILLYLHHLMCIDLICVPIGVIFSMH